MWHVFNVPDEGGSDRYAPGAERRGYTEWVFGTRSSEELQVAMPLAGSAPQESDYARYETWLRDRGDDRARVLELDRMATAGRADPSELEELRQLATAADPLWWKLVSRTSPVLSCARSEERGADRFAFECDQRWSTLTPTADASVRHCAECQTAVHWCATEAEVAERARRGECVTVPRAVLWDASVKHQPTTVTGRPNPIHYWGKAIFGER